MAFFTMSKWTWNQVFHETLLGRPKVRLIWPWKVYISSPQWWGPGDSSPAALKRVAGPCPDLAKDQSPVTRHRCWSHHSGVLASLNCHGQPFPLWCLEMMEKGWCSRWYLQDLHQFPYRVWDGDQWRAHEAWKRSKDDFCWCFLREDACIQIIRMFQERVTFKISQICPNVLCKRHLFFWTRTHTRTTDIQDPVPLEIWWIWILNFSWFYQV